MTFPDTDLDIIIEAFLGADPNADPGTWPAPTDLSARLLKTPIRVTRGRRDGQKTAAAGSCSFELDNTDGALTPQQATSQYFGAWDLGVPMRVSVDDVGLAPPYPRFCGYVAEIAPKIVPGVGATWSTVTVTLAGTLRRLTQGSVAKSPLRRAFESAANVQTYWSLEDAGGSFRSGLPGQPALTLAGEIDFASASDMTGSAPLPVLTATSAISGPLSGTFTDRWFFDWLVNFPSVPSSLVTLMEIDVVGGSAARWVLTADSSTLTFTGYDAGGAVVHSSTGSSLLLVYGGGWLGLQLFVADGILAGLTVYDLSTTSLAGVQISDGSLIAGTPTAFRIPASSQLDGVAIGHIGLFSNAQPDDILIPNGPEPLNAYAGELAHVRFERLCLEQGIPYIVIGSDSRAVGPQPIADTVEILRDLETVDHGVLYELTSTWGLGYRASSQRFNRSPAFTVDLATYRVSEGDSPSVLTPMRNDTRIRNEWTISRPGGTTVTVRDEAHIAKFGRYEDSATVNVYDDTDAVIEASWRVREGNCGR